MMHKVINLRFVIYSLFVQGKKNVIIAHIFTASHPLLSKRDTILHHEGCIGFSATLLYRTYRGKRFVPPLLIFLSGRVGGRGWIKVCVRYNIQYNSYAYGNVCARAPARR